MDLELPDTDGLELARRISAQNPKVRIVLTTGLAEVAKLGLEFPVLLKPFGLDDLASAAESKTP